MVNAVERNKSGRWEGHLWTGRRGGKEEGESKGWEFEDCGKSLGFTLHGSV